MPLLYESPFPPEECRRRLEAATEPDSFVKDFKLRHGILSRFSDSGFRLRLRRAYMGNSFSRLLYGSWKTTPTGSSLELRIRLHPTVFVFNIIWFTGVIIVGGLGFFLGALQILTGDRYVAEGSPWFPVILFPGLLGFGIVLSRSGRGDGTELLKFMESVLEARAIVPRAA